MDLNSVLKRWLLLHVAAAYVVAIGEPEVRHVVCLAGESVQFHCDVSGSPTKRWSVRPAGSWASTPIYIHGTINPKFIDRLSCPTGDGRQLQLVGTRLNDSGIYTCSDTLDAMDITHVYLTVIAAAPSCSWNVTFDGLGVSDVIQVRCQVDYRGQQHPGPRGQCRLDGGTTETATLLTTTNNDTHMHHVELLYNIVIQNNMHNTNILCTTYFTTNNTLHPLNNNNTVLYSTNWTSPTINIRWMSTVVSQSSAADVTQTTLTVQRVSCELKSPKDTCSINIGLAVACACTTAVAVVLGAIVCVMMHSRWKGTHSTQHNSNVRITSSSQEQENDETRSASTAVIYDNVSRPEPQYISLNPVFVGELEVYSKLQIAESDHV